MIQANSLRNEVDVRLMERLGGVVDPLWQPGRQIGDPRIGIRRPEALGDRSVLHVVHQEHGRLRKTVRSPGVVSVRLKKN